MRRWLWVFVLAGCGDDHDATARTEVAPVAIPDGSVRDEPPWPIYGDARCDEACLFERYQNEWTRLQGMEVGGMEMMLGEALAGGALLVAATTPTNGAPSIARCEAMQQEPVTVMTESQHRPQRDCFFECMSNSDPRACVRDHACSILPVLDGSWTRNTLSPRLGCLAQLTVAVKRECQALEVTEVRSGGVKACSPRKACREGADGVDPKVAPYVIPPQTACDVRPLAWWCTDVYVEYPRAQCQYGRWRKASVD